MSKHPLKGVADHLATKGRYGDTMLVHMNPIEVQGLAALSPTGSLTINPDTGQPEAFLPMLLPLLGSIGGAWLGPTLGVSAALGGAIGSGLGSFAATGDVQKGIMSGVLGYGLGSAGELLGSAGAAAGEAGAAGAAAGDAGLQAATATPAVETAAHTMPGGVADFVPATGDATTAAAMPAAGRDQVAELIAKNAKPDMSGMSMGERYGNIVKGLGTPGALKHTFVDNAMSTTLPIGMGLYSELSQMAPQPGEEEQPVGSTYQPNLYGTTGRRYLGPGMADPRGFERRYFAYADGGKVGDDSVESLIRKHGTDTITVDDPKFNDKKFEQRAKMLERIFEAQDKMRQEELGRQPYWAPSQRRKPELRFKDGGKVDNDDPPAEIDATEKDWRYGRPDGKGGIKYTKDNPAYVKKQYRKAQDEIDYLTELTRRQAPWTLNENRVGKGLSPENRSQAYDWARLVSQATIGQPYGFMVPPTEEDFAAAQQRMDDLRSRYEYEPRRFRGGGGVSGPGGGLDDAIPAIIDGKQAAALSSGEYVVPAHAVSALGNGSTEHGVRELDRMVDRTMQTKYGTKNRKPRPLKTQRVMPR